MIWSARVCSIVCVDRRSAKNSLVLCVLAGVLIAGCGGKSNSSSTYSTTATQLSLTVRGCKTAVYGQLARRWRFSPLTVRVGAVSFLYGRSYRSVPARELRGSGSGAARRYWSQKVLAVVDRGAITTVVIPERERGQVSLQYESSVPEPPYRISQGTTAVKFEACPYAATQFNGGFIVARPRCVQIDVHQNRQLNRAWIPFGTGQQPCPKRSNPA